MPPFFPINSFSFAYGHWMACLYAKLIGESPFLYGGGPSAGYGRASDKNNFYLIIRIYILTNDIFIYGMSF